MLKNKYHKIILPLFFIFEILIVLCLFFYLNNAFLYNFLTEAIIIFFIWCCSSIFFQSYKVLRTNSFFIGILPSIKTLLFFIILYLLLVASYQPLDPFYKLNHFKFISIIFISIFCYSSLRQIIFYSLRSKGRNVSHIVLIDNFDNDDKFYDFKNSIVPYGYYLRHRINSFTNLSKMLKNIIAQHRIDYVFLFQSDNKIIDEVKFFCDQSGIRLKIILNMKDNFVKKSGLEILSGYPIINVRNEPLLHFGNRFVKRLIDILMSILSIIFVLSWLSIVVKIIQRISYPGPLFFAQDRIGLDGKKFKLFKFRTMRIDVNKDLAKKGYSAKTIKKDPRVTPFGKLLRKTNLDESPQFFNVLIGNMSTVGPRPHMIGEDEFLEKNINNYKVRRFVKPGITGWAAMNGLRGGTDDLSLMEKRTNLDIFYIENWSILLDIRIILKTITQMLTLRIPKAY